MDFEAVKSGVSAIAERYGLNFIVLFGSQAIGRTHPRSDIDLAVASKSPIDSVKLWSEFSRLLRRDDIEIVDLSRASPTLWQAVSRDGRLLYEKTPDVYWRWQIYARKIWMETAWL